MSKIQPVVMCGGSGTRVWPESRESLPKQFIPLIGDRSTFQSVVGLLGDRSIFEPPVVITNFDYRFRVAEQLKEIGAEATILLEPERRDSAAAVGAAVAWAAGRDPATVVAVLAADHVFEEEAKFAGLCARAGAAAEAGEIVTFGVTPDHPATGYGYIHPGEALAVDPAVRRVERFVEKPDEDKAKTFIAEGYLWNSGNFVFRADVMLEELERFEPEIAAAAREGVARAKTDLGFIVLDRESFRPGAEDVDRLRGDGADPSGGGAGGRRRLVGRRPMVDRLAAEPAGRAGQQPARPGRGDRLLERAGAVGGSTGRGDRARQRDRDRHGRRGAGRRPGAAATRSRNSSSG